MKSLKVASLLVSGLILLTAFNNCAKANFGSEGGIGEASSSSLLGDQETSDSTYGPVINLPIQTPVVIPAGTQVYVHCAVDASLPQTLSVTLQNGARHSWPIGYSIGQYIDFTFNYASAPAKFESSTPNGPNQIRYSNVTSHSVSFDSEDSTDGDYNDLVCAITW